MLWHAADVEHHWYRWMHNSMLGLQLYTDYERERRPAAVNTLPQLVERLAETRLAIMELAGRFGETALRQRYVYPPCDVELSFADALRHLAEHDREHTRQVRELLR